MESEKCKSCLACLSLCLSASGICSGFCSSSLLLFKSLTLDVHALTRLLSAKALGLQILTKFQTLQITLDRV